MTARKPSAEAPIRSTVPLGYVAHHIAMIEIRCRRCDRHGRISTAKLVAEHGADAGMPAVLSSFAGDCPQRQASGAAYIRRICCG